MKTSRLLLFLIALPALHPSSAAADAPPPLVPELAAKNPVSLLPDDLKGSMKFRNDTESTPPSTAVWNTDAELRVENFSRPEFTDHVSVNWNFRQPARRGDVVLARFLARAEYARQESGEAEFEFTVKQDQPTYAAHVKLPLTAGPDWALMEIPFLIQRDVTADQGRILLSFGTIPQAVQIAGLEILNFGKRVKQSDLPQTRFTYRGREQGAAWREAALARIEKHRTATISLRVIDSAGKPVPDARVGIRLKRPAFLWATSVDSSFILSDSPDASKYRETLLAMFDAATIENGFKWPKWSGGVANREEALRASDWIQAQGLRQRGHTLSWPADKFSPRRIAEMPAPRENLSILVQEHIRDIMAANRGRIYGWDVINEMIHERDYFKYIPETEVAEWFKVARKTDPHTKLFINDYGMLNSRKSPNTIASYLKTVDGLLAAGAPIDVMGIQGHVGRQVRSPEDVLKDLDLLAGPGLELQITEFDVNTADEELQADYTRDFLIALYSHPSVTGFTKWGFWERKHWKPDAAMFRADWSEKPNAKVWRDLVRGAWLTNVEATTDAVGNLTTRGHLGDYEFNVTVGGKPLRQMRTVDKEGADLTLQFP
jgi:GH35 family endo-1,4-beta-xylanase